MYHVTDVVNYCPALYLSNTIMIDQLYFVRSIIKTDDVYVCKCFTHLVQVCMHLFYLGIVAHRGNVMVTARALQPLCCWTSNSNFLQCKSMCSLFIQGKKKQSNPFFIVTPLLWSNLYSRRTRIIFFSLSVFLRDVYIMKASWHFSYNTGMFDCPISIHPSISY